MYTGIFNTKQSVINDLIMSTECHGNRGESAHVLINTLSGCFVLDIRWREESKQELCF